jgi:thiol-disulfide isomerase/thioredoxin
MKKWIVSIVLFFLFFIPKVSAKEVTLYLFHSESCPHCKSERQFLEDIKEEYPDVAFVEYEVSSNKENMTLLKNVKLSLQDNNNYVPYTVIGRYSLVGFNDNTKSSIRNYLDECLKNQCEDVVSEVIEKGGIISLEEEEKEETTTFTLPILKEVDARKISLPIVAIVIGFIDGFNPCAMWVLIFLISMLLGMKDRKRMWILGLTFLGTSALIYLLFMVAWLKITLEMQSIIWIRILIAIVALIGGIVNLHSYQKMKKEKVGCTVTDHEKQKKIMAKIKKFTSEKSFLLAVLGVITLAISVNFVELACSAGLPLVFTQILALNNLNVLEYSFYIFLYILFFLLDDLIVFFIAMFTLKITGITNKYNKYSHLIGGIIMLIIGILLIFKPGILMFNF